MPSCIRVADQSEHGKLLQSALLAEGFVSQEACRYHLVLYRGVSACSAQEGLPSGFLRLEFYREQTPLYQVQKEFSGMEEKIVIPQLVERMGDELRSRARQSPVGSSDKTPRR